MISRQTDFFAKHRELSPRRITHGGSGARGLRKITRPLDRRRPVHLVLRSSSARGDLSFLGARNRLVIERTIREWAARFDVKIQGLENVGSHLHIVARFPRRENFQNFLRTITALIARRITGARRGRPFGRKFWDDLAFSRVITGHRDFRGVQNYLFKNRLESEIGALSRRTVEEYEHAVRLARRRGVAVWKILEESSA